MLNKRSFIYQAGILAASNTALLLLGFAYRILIGRLAGPEGMGVYTLVIQVYTIVMAVSVYGMCVAVTHMGASLNANHDLCGVRRLIRFAFIWFLSLFVLMAIPIALFRNAIAANILGDPRTAPALLMILACVFFTGFENILKALFHGMRLVKYTSISEVGEQILRISLAAALLLKFINNDHGRTALLILCAMTLSELYSVLFLCAAYFKKIVRPARNGRPKNKNIRRSFIRLALPSTITSVLGNVFASFTVILFPLRLMRAGYMRVNAVSTLGVISGMISPVLMLPSAFINALCTLLMPTIAGCVSRNNQQELQAKIGKGVEAIGLLGVPSTALILPFTSLICVLLFEQTASFSLIFLLAVDLLVIYYITFINCVLNGLGRQKQVLLLAASREIVQLTLVWFLTAMPSLHVYGYVIGLLLGDTLHMVTGMAYIHRITAIKMRPFHSAVVPAACAIILYCTARLLFFQLLSMGLTLVVAFLFTFLCCILLYILLLRLLGIRVLSYFRRTLFIPSDALP
ncbi:oligosaccharide flippase family protein [Christensenellaceae bacterium OttesenSCG-928-M15]|nr:oligosaccharide flippase family protein [Christensenellaceae bacterium OttesenSCG-928-M15]